MDEGLGGDRDNRAAGIRPDASRTDEVPTGLEDPAAPISHRGPCSSAEFNRCPGNSRLLGVAFYQKGKRRRGLRCHEGRRIKSPRSASVMRKADRSGRRSMSSASASTSIVSGRPSRAAKRSEPRQQEVSTKAASTYTATPTEESPTAFTRRMIAKPPCQTSRQHQPVRLRRAQIPSPMRTRTRLVPAHLFINKS